jgi:hypothetical protein
MASMRSSPLMTNDLAAFLDAAEARLGSAEHDWDGYVPDLVALVATVRDLTRENERLTRYGLEMLGRVIKGEVERDNLRAENTNLMRERDLAMARVRAVLALCDKPIMSDIVGIGYVHYVSVDDLRAALLSAIPPTPTAEDRGSGEDAAALQESEFAAGLFTAEETR